MTGHGMTDNTRIIKKYPNRRLYDTEVSRYITLENIRQLATHIQSEKITTVRQARAFIEKRKAQ